jgi:hypothetical protein
MSWLFLSLSGFATRIDQDWTAADIAMSRLKPADFTEVPSAVRAELERRGCTVPQPQRNRRMNIVSGNPHRRQVDWAALCSRERVSVILVFRGASTTDVAELAPADRDYLHCRRRSDFRGLEPAARHSSVSTTIRERNAAACSITTALTTALSVGSIVVLA